MHHEDNEKINNINLLKVRSDLKTFRSTCPQFFQFGKLKYFHFFYCPISVALADADEFIREEYESTEKLILHLYDAGLNTVETISEVTGLDKRFVGKILELEENAYKHIKNGEITEMGQATLNDGSYNHYIYEVKKEIQFEAVTGTVLSRDIEQRKDKLLKGLDSNFNRAVPLSEVDASVTKDIIERLEEYKILEKSVIDKNIKTVRKVTTHTLRFIYGYVVSFDYLPDPFIILSGSSFNKEKKSYTQIWKPTAISQSDAGILVKNNVEISPYNIRHDSYFDYLKTVIDSFHIADEEINLIDDKSQEKENNKEVRDVSTPVEVEEFTEDIEMREDINSSIKLMEDDNEHVSAVLEDLKALPELKLEDKNGLDM